MAETKAMIKDRLSIDESYRTLIEQMISKDLLGFKGLDNKDIFAFAAVLGMDEPKDIKKKYGFVRTQYLDNDNYTLAIIDTLLLGKANDYNELDRFSDFNDAIDYSEKCAQNGFQVLSDKVTEADGDRDLLERRLQQEIDDLYLLNVENNI